MAGHIVRMLAVFSMAVAGYGALITEAEFNAAVTANGFPAPSSEQYKNIVARAGPSGMTTKQELAMFLAHVLHESDGLRAKVEYNPPAHAYDGEAGALPGKLYCGRGYLRDQFIWAYNYLEASRALYEDDRLLKDPDQVDYNDAIAWDTAFWLWGDKVRLRTKVAEGKFGVTTKALNGDRECVREQNGITWWQQEAGKMVAKRRFGFYEKIFKEFKLPGQPIESGCYN